MYKERVFAKSDVNNMDISYVVENQHQPADLTTVSCNKCDMLQPIFALASGRCVVNSIFM